MKKATLLTFLFAILMIALLVSCNTPPDPLPSGGGETTTDAVPSTDGGGAAVEPSLTSEMAEVTTAEEKEPEKTTYWASWEVSDLPPLVDVNATTAPMPDIEPDPNVRPDEERRYYYLVPDEETLSEVNEPVKIADTETPWYITEWETQSAYVLQEVPADKQNLAFHFPKTATAEMTDMKITVDFFQEYYRLGDPVQIRITIENKTEKCMEIGTSLLLKNYIDERDTVAIVALENGKIGTLAGNISIGYFPRIEPYSISKLPAEIPSRYNGYAYGYYTSTGRYISYLIFPEEEGSNGAQGETFQYYLNTFGNGTAVVEYLLNTPIQNFGEEKEYAVIVQLGTHIADSYGFLPYKYLRIPMEIVEYESVSP